MIEATHRSGQFIYDYQSLIAGSFALLAAIITAGFLGWKGKRERDFRMKQDEIKKQTKRRAVAVMLASDMLSVVEIANCKELAKTAKRHAEKLKILADGESYPIPLFLPVDKTFLNNYSHYIENMPLMHIEAVREVSRFYIFATTLSEIIALSNAKMEDDEESNKTKASFLNGLSRFAEETENQLDLALPWLDDEAAEAQKELDRLNGVKEKSDSSAP